MPLTSSSRGGDRKYNAIIYMDITLDGHLIGRMTIELRYDVAPLACENFRVLCTGERGKDRDGKRMHYKGCIFHRVARDYLCQGGDWVLNDGSENQSSYQHKPNKQFHDENFILRHCGPGVLSMANAGPDTNGSQFFLTFVETTWLDDKHVVFGYLMGEESMSVLDQIHEVGTENGIPRKKVMIADCGEILS